MTTKKSNYGGNSENGTADGQMLYWDDVAKEWKHTEDTEIKWDDTTKTLGISEGIGVGDDFTTSAVVGGATVAGKLVAWVDDGNPLVAEIGVGRAEDTASTTGGTLFGARSRGTLAAKTIVQDGDNLLDIIALGHDGADFALAARIDIEVDGTPSANVIPGCMKLRTADSAGTMQDAAVFTSKQKLLVGTTTDKDTGTGVGVGTHALQIEGLVRYGPGWRDNIASLAAARAPSVNFPDYIAWNGGIWAYAFDDTSLEELPNITWHIDHDVSPGSTCYMHVHWTPVGTSTGTVRWGIEYSIAKGHQQAAFPTTTTVYIEQASVGTNLYHMIAEDSVGFVVPEVDSLVVARVFRDASHVNDTFVGDVFGLMVDIHYHSDRHATLNKAPNFYA